MARRPTPPPPQPAQLGPEQMQQGIYRLQKRLEAVNAFEPTSVVEQYNIPHVAALSASIDEALVRTFGADTLDYKRYADAAVFDNGPHNYAFDVPIAQVQASLGRSKARSIALLNEAIETLKERIAEAGPVPSAPIVLAERDFSRVFVVHGHDEGMREAVARFIEVLGFEPIILHEKASQGRTVIEKVEAHGGVDFAVVLLSPDDVGKANDDAELKPRARQNVLLELGYFIGRLGRSHVCALKRGTIEIPSDFGGVVYEQFDESGGWKIALGKELKAAGFPIDWNKVHA